MNHYRPSQDLSAAARPAPGKPALLRHLSLVENARRTPPRTWRDVVGNDDWDGRRVDRLARLVGGLDALASLDVEPLRLDEPLDPVDIDDDSLPAAHAVLAALHDDLPPWLQGEYVTIVHRLIARAARRGVAQWHRDPRRMAAAFSWLALGGNGATGRGRKVPAQDIWRAYGVSECRTLARRLCVDAQLGSLYPSDDDPTPMSDLHVVFGDVRLLHSSFRTYLLNERDLLERMIVDGDKRRSSRRPVQWVGDGQLSFKSRQVRPLWAFKAPSTTGRAAVMVAFGQDTDDDDYELIGMSVPDARELMALLEEALNAPVLAP